MHIVIGYTSTKGKEGAKVLCSEVKRGDAFDSLKNPPSGIVRTELFTCHLPNQRKFHEAGKAAKKATKKAKT